MKNKQNYIDIVKISNYYIIAHTNVTNVRMFSRYFSCGVRIFFARHYVIIA